MDAKLVVSLIDAYGRVTTARVEMTGLDAGTILVSAAALVGHLAAASDLGVTKAAVQFPLSGVSEAATAGSNTDVDGKIRGISDDSGETVVLRLPDPLDAAVNADGTINLAQIDVAAYLAHFETGGDAMLSDGEQVSTWRYGVLDAR